jgi:hypothetical protein
MSKKFKGTHICAYCPRERAFTGDHYFCVGVFLASARNDLPQALTCAKSNNEKSKLNRASLVFADKPARARFRAAAGRERLRRQLWRYVLEHYLVTVLPCGSARQRVLFRKNHNRLPERELETPRGRAGPP